MENWGCITLAENILLNDPRTTPYELLQRNARTIVHEVSHMWFGNLVTMRWWDDLWLNEGFANYIENYILDKLRPEFGLWSKYLKQVQDVAFVCDMTLERTHPVRLQVPSPDKLSSIFDIISYNKGSNICKMLFSYIGDEDLVRECLSVYMSRFAYANASSEEMLMIFDEVTGRNIS